MKNNQILILIGVAAIAYYYSKSKNTTPVVSPGTQVLPNGSESQFANSSNNISGRTRQYQSRGFNHFNLTA